MTDRLMKSLKSLEEALYAFDKEAEITKCLAAQLAAINQKGK